MSIELPRLVATKGLVKVVPATGRAVMDLPAGEYEIVTAPTFFYLIRGNERFLMSKTLLEKSLEDGSLEGNPKYPPK